MKHVEIIEAKCFDWPHQNMFTIICGFFSSLGTGKNVCILKNMGQEKICLFLNVDRLIIL